MTNYTDTGRKAAIAESDGYSPMAPLDLEAFSRQILGMRERIADTQKQIADLRRELGETLANAETPASGDCRDTGVKERQNNTLSIISKRETKSSETFNTARKDTHI